MKRFVVAVALALIACGAFAQTGAVYSLNVVGFQKSLSTPSGLTMAGMPFDDDNADLELNVLVSTQLTSAASYASADKIFMWDPTAQAYVRYYLRNYTRAGITNKWVNSTNDTVPTTDAFLLPEAGFWVSSPFAVTQTVVLVGDVVDETVLTNTLLVGLNLVSYPFSSDRAIKDMNLTNGTSASTYASADKIMAWDEQSQQYVRYYFRNYTRAGITNKWVLSTNDTVETTDSIPAGAGFWYSAIAQFDWKCVRPYTL